VGLWHPHERGEEVQRNVDKYGKRKTEDFILTMRSSATCLYAYSTELQSCQYTLQLLIELLRVNNVPPRYTYFYMLYLRYYNVAAVVNNITELCK